MSASEEKQISDLREIFAEEKLNEDLEEYVRTDEGSPMGWTILSHPLVQMYPYFPNMAKMANESYHMKRKRIRSLEEKGRLTSIIFFYERPYRLSALVKYWDRISLSEDRGKIFREVWTDSENIWQNLDEWSDLISEMREEERRDIMTDEDLDLLEKLPDQVEIFRGAEKGFNEGGLSWTTDESRAIWFANRFTSGDREPIILSATIGKEMIAFVNSTRDESEIVILPEFIEEVAG